MKKVTLFAGTLITLYSCGQIAMSNTPDTSLMHALSVPRELLTDDSTYWTISTVSSAGYVNKTPGSDYSNYKSGGGMIVKFKFTQQGRFKFLLYVQANTYGTDTETRTEVEGSVEFTKDIKGQDVFITHAEKGTCSITKNGVTTSRPVPEDELKRQHSSTYLWEKFDFPDDPSHTYLLVVDLKKYPQADVNRPGSIDPSWVSKFHIPGIGRK